MSAWPRGSTVRRDAGLWGYERALARHGLRPVAGADEAGRGACAGPLVAAAVVLPDGRRGQVPGLADSKLLTAAARERAYAEIVERALTWHAVVIPTADVDRLGLHVANVLALRSAVAHLAVDPSYVLLDGFPVPGLPAPSLAVWKGDRVAACVAAASVLAKVTRDRYMRRAAARHSKWDFETNVGYSTPEHRAAIARHGVSPLHRMSFQSIAYQQLRLAP
jgi:ribonuclease HII